MHGPRLALLLVMGLLLTHARAGVGVLYSLRRDALDPSLSLVGGPAFGAEPPHAMRFSPGRAAVIADRVADAGLPVEAITVEAWVRPDRAEAWAGLVTAVRDTEGFERGWALCLSGDGRRFCWGLVAGARRTITYLDAGVEIEPGAWAHVAGTFDGRAQRLFVNGQLVAESTEQSGPIKYLPESPVVIGAYTDDNDAIAFPGEIASVRISPSADDGAAIAARFVGESAGFAETARAEAAPTGAAPGWPVDWPTYMGDNARRGLSGAALDTPLSLAWVWDAGRPPSPSWPPPAEVDPYNGRTLEPRVVFDRVDHAVGVGDRVFVGSSADGRVRGLDLQSGRVVWTFATQGPVRCAPTVWNDRVVFGSDDGRVYALDAASGALLWSTLIAERDHRVVGNSHVASLWPVRTGVTAHQGRGFVCAGLFPTQGVTNAVIDLDTGRVIRAQRIDQPVQGYMVEGASGQLHAPTGRDPAGAIIDGPGDAPPPAAVKPAEGTLTSVRTRSLRFDGGEGVVRAFDAQTGEPRWSAPVLGRAYGLAITGGSLLVSTDAGRLYCFRPAGEGPAPSGEPEAPETGRTPGPAPGDRAVRTAEAVARAAPSSKGYALLLGTDGGEAAIALAGRTDLTVIGVEHSAERAAAAAAAVDRAGLGGRVWIHRSDGPDLPYVDELFNIVALADLDGPRPTEDELRRVVRPYGGVMLHVVRGVAETPWVKGPPEGAADWSHAYGDGGASGASGDQRVSDDLSMQWFGPPGPRRMVDRHQRAAPPLFVAGRMFIPGEDYVYAVDAYNGTILWEREVPEMFRPALVKSSGNMAATEDRLFLASGGECLAFDAQTGEIARRHAAPGSAEGAHDWGYVGVSGGTLIGTTTRPSAQRWPINGASWKIAYEDGSEIVASTGVFADDASTGQRLWTSPCEPGSIILSPTVAHDGGAVFFIETASDAAASEQSGRPKLADVFAGAHTLVSLDLADGATRYRRPVNLSAFAHVIHMSVSGGKILVTGSRYADRGGVNTLVYDLLCFNADDGSRRWTAEHRGAQQVIGGIHGEQLQRPVIVGGTTVHLEHTAYDLDSGEPLWEIPPVSRGGCGTLSASGRWGFRRLEGAAAVVNLATGNWKHLTRVTRPGCWINMIPAGGLLLIPEASSGCSCNHAIQTSLVMRPG